MRAPARKTTDGRCSYTRCYRVEDSERSGVCSRTPGSKAHLRQTIKYISGRVSIALAIHYRAALWMQNLTGHDGRAAFSEMLHRCFHEEKYDENIRPKRIESCGCRSAASFTRMSILPNSLAVCLTAFWQNFSCPKSRSISKHLLRCSSTRRCVSCASSCSSR